MTTIIKNPGIKLSLIAVLMLLANFTFSATDIFKEYSKKTITLDIAKRYPKDLNFDYEAIIKKMGDELEGNTDKVFNKVVDGPLHLFPVGPLDLWAIALPGTKFLIVYHLEPGGLAERAGVQRFDEIHGFNGQLFKKETGKGYEAGEYGPVKSLGDALDTALLKGGIQLMLNRKVFSKRKPNLPPKIQKKKVVIKLKKIGKLGPIYPAKCRKSELFTKELTKLAIEELEGRHHKTNILIGLALLASGDPKYLPILEELAQKTIPKLDQAQWPQANYLAEGNIGSSWEHGFAIVFLVEYFFATGDQRVYAALQRMIYNVPDKHQNAFGGFGHGGGNGSYYTITFGPQGGMNLLGLGLAKKIGMKVDPIAFERYYNMVTGKVFRMFNGDNSKLNFDANGYYTVGYSHTLSRARTSPRIGESAFNTATSLLAFSNIPQIGYSKEIAGRLRATIAPFPQLFTFIHASPGLGHYWAILAMASTDPSGQNLRRLLDYRRYWLTYSRFNDGTWSYVYPKYSRYSLPAGGGWGGDGYLNMDKIHIAQCLLMMNIGKKKLLMQGNMKRNWLKPAISSKETITFMRKYDNYFAQASLNKFTIEYGKAIKVRSSRSSDDSLFALVPLHNKVERLYHNYAKTSSGKKIKSLLYKLKGHIGKGDKKRAAYRLKQFEYAYKNSFAVDGHERAKRAGFSKLQANITSYLEKEYSKYKLPQGSEKIYRSLRGMKSNDESYESEGGDGEDEEKVDKKKKKKKKRKK